MTCYASHDWTVRFPDIGGEYRPTTLTLKKENRKLNYCRAKFDGVVGEQIKEHSHDSQGDLYGRRIVEVLVDGSVVSRLMSSPDGLEFGERYFHVELYDPQKSLDSGVVDYHFQGSTLEQTYKRVFDIRESNLLNGIKFSFPEEIQYPSSSALLEKTRQQRGQDTIDATETGLTAQDFDNISPLRAIYKLNNKYRLNSWVDNDLNLWVGHRDVLSQEHIAAPNDERVWRYKDVNIRHSGSPIKGVTLRGNWMDEDGARPASWSEAFDAVNPLNDKNKMDYQVVGVAERMDIDSGVMMEAKNENIKRRNIQKEAQNILIEETSNQNSGAVQINASKSGSHTDLKKVKPGDAIHIIPHNKYFEEPYTASTGEIGHKPEKIDDTFCGSVPRNERYEIDSVQHRIHQTGRWETHLDVSLLPGDNIDFSQIQTKTVLFNPNPDSEEDKILTLGEGHSGFFEGGIVERD